ncbi:MAG: molybdopterin-dependent oxidoreductase [Vicinamibacterales bacterium]
MTTRRTFVRTSAAAWAALAWPGRAWALQAGEEMVPFTDYTEAFSVEAQAANPTVRCLDLRTLTTWATPNADFYAFNQTTVPRLDADTFRLRIGGFVDTPRELTLAELMARPDRRDLAVTLECSGNSTRPTRMSGLLSNGVWTGVPLAAVLRESGLKAEAREVVFLGADLEREKKWQAGNREFEAPHGRSVYVQGRAAPGCVAGLHLNGDAAAQERFSAQAAAARLAWHDADQVADRRGADRRYEGQHQVRNYLSLRAVETGEGRCGSTSRSAGCP